MEPKKKRQRASSFKLEFPGDDDIKTMMLGKIKTVKEQLLHSLQKPVNNFELLDHLLEYWICKHRNIDPDFTTFQKVDTDKDEKLFVTTSSACSKLTEIAHNHASLCHHSLQHELSSMSGHVAVVKLTCPASNLHRYTWSSSPHFSDNKFLVNHRILHGFQCSGMLPVQYERFATSVGFGHISREKRAEPYELYTQCVEEEYRESVELCMDMEQAMEEGPEKGIAVMSDARHGWWKNAQDTSVVIIGEHSHKVLCHEHVSKQDDKCPQRHEALGTKKVMDYFEEIDVKVEVWVHDMNATVNKEVKSRGINNQNDLWHGVKNLKKALKKISEGPKKNHGKTWHVELSDKLLPISTHAHYAVRHCEGDAAKLMNSFDNIAKHYQNIHDECDPNSRCRKDPHYEPTRRILESSVAIDLLSKALRSSLIYKNAAKFSLGKDTHYVESFNNVLNIFHDKRIAFSSEEYRVRSHLAVLHWNENVDRKYTSVWQKPTTPGRRGKEKKVYKDPTYFYRDKLWNRFLSKLKE